MRYMHYFESANTFDVAYNGDEYHEPWVSLTMQNRDVHYNKNKEIPLKEMPLTFEILSPGELFFGHSSDEFSRTIEYSKNGGEWTSITSSLVTYSEGEEPLIVSGGTKIQVVSGDTIQFRGDNSAYGDFSNHAMFGSFNSRCKVKGNIMSLINSTNFSGLTTLTSDNTFVYLFASFTGLTDSNDLILPATTLAQSCYSFMFADCTSLVNGPSSIGTSATTMMPAYACNSMFANCTSLTQAPELPATTLAEDCYDQMFQDCTSLVNAPTLPAPTLAGVCYSNMFQGCTSLNYIKCLATDISAGYCTSMWVEGVASTGTFVKPASTDWSSKTGNDGIPSGWTVQNV